MTIHRSITLSIMPKRALADVFSYGRLRNVGA